METEGKTSPQATSEATPEQAAEDRSPEESPEDRSEDTPEEEPEDVPLSMEDRRGLLQGVLSKKSDTEDGDVGEEERTPSEDGSPDRGKRTDPPPSDISAQGLRAGWKPTARAEWYLPEYLEHVSVNELCDRAGPRTATV